MPRRIGRNETGVVLAASTGSLPDKASPFSTDVFLASIVAAIAAVLVAFIGISDQRTPPESLPSSIRERRQTERVAYFCSEPLASNRVVPDGRKALPDSGTRFNIRVVTYGHPSKERPHPHRDLPLVDGYVQNRTDRSGHLALNEADREAGLHLNPGEIVRAYVFIRNDSEPGCTSPTAKGVGVRLDIESDGDTAFAIKGRVKATNAPELISDSRRGGPLRIHSTRRIALMEYSEAIWCSNFQTRSRRGLPTVSESCDLGVESADAAHWEWVQGSILKGVTLLDMKDSEYVLIQVSLKAEAKSQ